MRILLPLLILVSITILFANSYAQSNQNSHFIILAQIRVEDSNGNLVAYLEPSSVTVFDIVKLNNLLDQNSALFQKSMIAVGDQKYEIIHVTDLVIHHSSTIVSQNFFSETNGQHSEELASVNHDGYPVVSGDKVTTVWTVIRPAS